MSCIFVGVKFWAMYLGHWRGRVVTEDEALRDLETNPRAAFDSEMGMWRVSA